MNVAPQSSPHNGSSHARGAGRGSKELSNRLHEESKRRAREFFDKHPYRKSIFKETYE